MKITKAALKQLIREEIENALHEDDLEEYELNEEDLEEQGEIDPIRLSPEEEAGVKKTFRRDPAATRVKHTKREKFVSGPRKGQYVAGPGKVTAGAPKKARPGKVTAPTPAPKRKGPGPGIQAVGPSDEEMATLKKKWRRDPALTKVRHTKREKPVKFTGALAYKNK